MMRLPWQKSDLHPHALSLTDEAIEDDFDTALADDLASLNPPSIIHRYRCVAPSGVHDAALMEQGFSAVRMTRMIDLPLDLADHPALSADVPDEIAPHWFRLGERGPWTQWVAAHWRHYQAMHLSNPPREPVNGLNKIFLSKDLVDCLAMRLGPQGRVRSFASLREGSKIGWIGGNATLLPQTLAACLRRAAAAGWVSAMIEVDNEDTALWSLIELLKIETRQTFVTWQLERDPAKRPN